MHQGRDQATGQGRPSQEHCGPILEEGGGGPAAGQARHSCGEQEHRQGVEIHQPSRPRWEAVGLEKLLLTACAGQNSRQFLKEVGLPHQGQSPGALPCCVHDSAGGPILQKEPPQGGSQL